MTSSEPATLNGIPARAHAWLARGENWLVSIVLLAMAILPAAEIVVREFFGSGIPGSITLTQQGTLWIALLGGALAARENRLLAFDALKRVGTERTQHILDALRGGLGAGVSLVLAWASWELVRLEMEGAETVGLGIPTWVSQLVLPVGFGLVALRMIWHTPTGWRGRLAHVLLAASVFWALHSCDFYEGPAYSIGIVLVVFAMTIGAPIFAVIGGLALVFFAYEDIPFAAMPAEAYRIVASPTLPTIPLFTLAGMLLSRGGSSERLVRLFHAWFGWLPGGIAVATVGVCAFFTSFTGASGVTILALGGLLFPMLVDNGYKERFSLGLITGSGSIGLMFPPSLPLILFAVVAQTPVDKMFVATLVPGLVLTSLLMGYGAWRGYKTGVERNPFVLKDALQTARETIWELLFPLGILFGIFGGFVTLVEAAALSVLYAMFIPFVIHRELSIRKDLLPVLVDTAVMVGGVMIIVGAAFGLTSYLVDAMIPTQIMEWMETHIESRWVLLLLLNVFLLGVGCIMDIFSAIVVVVPLIIPIGQAFDIHPYHLGAIFLANLELGYLTPPVGMNLFLSSYRFGKPLGEVYRAAIPYFLLLIVGVLLITYVEPLSTALPDWIFGVSETTPPPVF